jgi:hypothetical protein
MEYSLRCELIVMIITLVLKGQVSPNIPIFIVKQKKKEKERRKGGKAPGGNRAVI